MQTDLVAIHSKAPKDRFFAFRMGINLGEIVADKDDIYGEGVNLAARLESLAEPGGICISEDIYRQVRHKLSINFDYLGVKSLKNLSEAEAVYHVSFGKKRRGSAKVKERNPDRGGHNAQSHASSNIIPNSKEKKDRLLRQIKVLGAIWTILFVIDIGTGPGIWAHWPGIAIATIWGIMAVLFYVSGWNKRIMGCYAVIVAGLAVVNLITWSGYPWVLWPAAGLVFIELMRRLAVR
jgi:adenylate cyclase